MNESTHTSEVLGSLFGKNSIMRTVPRHDNSSSRRIFTMTSEGLESQKRSLVIPCRFPIFLQFDHIQVIVDFRIKYLVKLRQLILWTTLVNVHTYTWTIGIEMNH